MALERQVISWPLTGGIDTKTAPLMIQPGSHITLDNVRQERTNEWRARPGTNRSALDSIPGVALISASAGNGGAMAVISGETSSGSNLFSYNPGYASNRWSTKGSNTSAIQPQMAWTRRTVIPNLAGTATVPNMLSSASDGVTSQVLDCDSAIGINGDTGLVKFGIVSSPGIGAGAVRARSVYATNGSLFVRIYILASGVIQIIGYDQSGNNVFANGSLFTDANLTSPHLDAIQYPGQSTITFVYRTATASQFRFVEYNASTQTLVTSSLKAVNCDNCLCLLPDPDSSGNRFVALSSATPNVQVLRMDSTGAILTTDTPDTKIATQIAGVAYQAGTSWQIVYQTSVGILAAKKFTGVVGAAATIYSDTRITLHSNAWRDTGSDGLTCVIGYHSGLQADPQDSYFVMYLLYGSSSVVSSSAHSPIASILPLDAGPALATSATLPQASKVATGTWEVPLFRLNRFSRSADRTLAASALNDNRYSADLFRGVYLSSTNMQTINIGPPKAFGPVALIPGGLTGEFGDGSYIAAHGTMTIPPSPGLTGATAAGLLNLLSTYQYLVMLVARSDNGAEWRSPPSIPSTVTLTGTQNRVAVTTNFAVQLEMPSRILTLEVYRTKANGSIFQKVISKTAAAGSGGITSFTFNDDLSDAVLSSADFFYAQAAAPTTLTPAFSHVEFFQQRAFGIHRDYRDQILFSKKITTGRSPEFAAGFQISLGDEEGDCTNIAALDDKIIIFKQSAIYFIQGDGPDEAGTGSYPTATRIDSDVGSIVGSPVVSTGQEVYFVSARGIYMMDRSLQVQFIGAPVDQFLNQPLIQARETVIGAVFSPATNEVRFQTTNYRLVYDRLRGIWYRDTGTGMQNVVSTCMVGSKQALFKTDGTMWIEGDENTSGDNSVSFTGKIRSAWVRPSGMEGRLRLYMARVVMVRTAGGDAIDPVFRIYYDNDDSIVESFPNTAVDSLATAIGASVQPRRHRCRSFSLEIEIPLVDDSSALARLRLETWGAEVGLRSGAFRNPAADRWT